MSDKQFHEHRQEICVDDLKLFTKRKTLRALIGAKETERIMCVSMKRILV